MAAAIILAVFAVTLVGSCAESCPEAPLARRRGPRLLAGHGNNNERFAHRRGKDGVGLADVPPPASLTRA